MTGGDAPRLSNGKSMYRCTSHLLSLNPTPMSIILHSFRRAPSLSKLHRASEARTTECANVGAWRLAPQ
jgi:hypothetical protein